MILYPSPDAVAFTDTIVSIDGQLLGLEFGGVAWIFETLQGWGLGGGVEANFDPRPGAHGTFDAQVWRRARVITISGTCIADTPELAEQAQDALAALLADGQAGTFTVSNSRRSLSATVRLSDTPLDETINDCAFRWSFQFTAPDRRRYGDTVTQPTRLPGGRVGGLDYNLDYPLDYGTVSSTGRVQFTNDGNAPTEPLFKVTPGLASGFEITHVETGRRLRYPQPVTQDVQLDAATGRVTVGGQNRSRYLTVRQWPSIPPKSSATFAFAALGGETFDTSPSQLVVTAAPAYH